MSLKSYQLQHPKIKGRIALDYPLDILLNRKCKLRDYERGIMGKLRDYNAEVDRVIFEGKDEIIGNDLIKILIEIDKEKKKQESEIKWEESEGRRNENRKSFMEKKLGEYFKKYKEWLDKFVEVYQYCDGEIGCIELPDEPKDERSATGKDDKNFKKPGTGNILIKGRPGTGKSTLALQMAVACTWMPNGYSSIFFSLEESYENIYNKASIFGWDEKIRKVEFLEDVTDSSSDRELGESLKRLLTQYKNCYVCDYNDGTRRVEVCTPHANGSTAAMWTEPCVLIPLLSPRTITPSERGPDALFWERYKQLEKLLIAARYLREGEQGKPIAEIADGIPDIRMVCIDSLNVFGDELLTRTEMFKLFDLLDRFGVIGVITAENDPKAGDPADYLADVVIQLHKEEDEGYALRYLEILKSRFQHEVYGRHPLRMRGQEIFTEHRKQWIDPQKIKDKIDTIGKELLQ